MKEKIMGLLLFIMIGGCLKFCSDVMTTDVRNGIVTKKINNIITVTDEYNNKWVVHSNTFSIGDFVKITVHNNNTDLDTSDDTIIKIKKMK